MDKERIAHDLAILYMQAEMKDGLIVPSPDGTIADFVNEYQERYLEVLDYLEGA